MLPGSEPAEQRQVKTKPDPQRHRETKQLRRGHEVRHHGDGGNGSDGCAEHAIDGFGTSRARERLRSDVDSRHRPIGTRQIEPQRGEQRQHRGHEGFAREHEGHMADQKRVQAHA